MDSPSTHSPHTHVLSVAVVDLAGLCESSNHCAHETGMLSVKTRATRHWVARARKAET